MDNQSQQLIALLAVVAGIALAYGKTFGGYQFQIVEWTIAAWKVPSRFRGIVNLGVGVVLASVFSALAAWRIGDWGLLPLGFLAGVLASVEASRVHDGQPPAEEIKASAETVKPTPITALPK